MLESEKFAIAAHLHVLLRRVHGRVTDVEWMIRSPEYAREVIRVARGESHDDLRRLADKLEVALGLAPRPAPLGRPASSASGTHSASRSAQPAFAHTESGAPSTHPPSEYPSGFGGGSSFDPKTGRKRYVGSLR